MMAHEVLFDADDGIARITLNRPEHLNTFNEALAHAWVEATQAAVSSAETRAILVAANGRVFSAGGDVKAMAALEQGGAELTRIAEILNTGLLNLIHSSIPVVTAAHGTTAGGGLGFLLCGDYAVVGESSKIGSLYANVALTPDLSVTALLARAVGERRALQLVLQDRTLTAQEAREWGLVAEVVPDAQVLLRAERIARVWADSAPDAYGQAKRLIRSASTRSLADQLIEEAQTIGASLNTDAAQQRIRAFIHRADRA